MFRAVTLHQTELPRKKSSVTQEAEGAVIKFQQIQNAQVFFSSLYSADLSPMVVVLKT